MNRRCIQVVVLVLVTALWAGSQCLASCLLAAEANPSGSCHHHSSSPSGKPDQACERHHFEYFNPEHTVDLEKAGLVSATGLPFLTLTSSEQVLTPPLFHSLWMTEDRGAPPGTKTYLSLSILRI